MPIQQRVAFGALLGAALTAHAAQPTRTPDPTDPAVAVPAVTYVSVLADATAAPATAPTPDKLWRAANDAVGAQSNHAMHQDHSPAAAAPAPRKGDAPAPARPDAAHAQHKHH